MVCAKMELMATARIKVDLPDMFEPVISILFCCMLIELAIQFSINGWNRSLAINSFLCAVIVGVV